MLHSGQIYPLMSRISGRRRPEIMRPREGEARGGRGSRRAISDTASRTAGPDITQRGQAIRPEELPVAGTRTATMRPPGTWAQRDVHTSPLIAFYEVTRS